MYLLFCLQLITSLNHLDLYNSSYSSLKIPTNTYSISNYQEHCKQNSDTKNNSKGFLVKELITLLEELYHKSNEISIENFSIDSDIFNAKLDSISLETPIGHYILNHFKKDVKSKNYENTWTLHKIFESNIAEILNNNKFVRSHFHQKRKAYKGDKYEVLSLIKQDFRNLFTLIRDDLYEAVNDLDYLPYANKQDEIMVREWLKEQLFILDSIKVKPEAITDCKKFHKYMQLSFTDDLARILSQRIGFGTQSTTDLIKDISNQIHIYLASDKMSPILLEEADLMSGLKNTNNLYLVIRDSMK